jgi:hypothetical protein
VGTKSRKYKQPRITTKVVLKFGSVNLITTFVKVASSNIGNKRDLFKLRNEST